MCTILKYKSIILLMKHDFESPSRSVPFSGVIPLEQLVMKMILVDPYFRVSNL